MKIFQELGELVEGRWREKNYNEDIFSEIATDALSEARLSSKVDPWEILEWVFNQTWLPEQRDVEAKFSNAPITLHTGQRFYIDAYYWLDGTTTIHQHAFSGAFQVLHGSSLHSIYSFIPQQQINDHFAIGEIRLEQVELLEKDDIRAIHGGMNFTHSLFHLDRPSVTIAARTNSNPTKFPQYDYRKPFVANNSFYKEQALLKKLQSLSILYGMKKDEADDFANALLENADLQTTFFVLENLRHWLCGDRLQKSLGINISDDRFETLVETSRKKHGETINKFLTVFEETERASEIVGRRGIVSEPEHRFFLALLLNVDGSSHIFDLIRKKFPEDDPVEKILDWATELSATRVLGTKELNVLGIENFNDDYIAVMECLLKEINDDEIESVIAESYSEEYANGLKDSIPRICHALRSSAVFKSLLR